MDLTVCRIDRTPIKVPFRKPHERHMARQWPSWKYFEIFEVELETGHVGYGETMLFYTWNGTTTDDVDRVLEENAIALLWDDSLGEGLQMALLDAVGRAAGVPIHSLLGLKRNDRTPLAWWCNDMPADDWIVECQEAIRRGYTSIKLKGRPWFDIRHQIEKLSERIPGSFEIIIDFNSTLLDADRAIPLLQELEVYPQVETFEGPIPDEDLNGYRAIRDAVDADIARHYTTNMDIPLHDRETPTPGAVLTNDVCDGFVVTGGADTVLQAGAVAAMADKPFLLQQVGTDIAAAFSLHFGGVLSHSRWPAVNCHQLFDRSLLTDLITVAGGKASVPDRPGLGYEVDTEVVEELQVDRPDSKPSPPRLIEVRWPNGPRMYFATGQEMPDYARAGELPYYQREVSTRLIPDDGSDWWQDLREQALKAPVVVEDA